MPQALALLSAALPIKAGATDVHLVPAGEFAGRDGRPGNGRRWNLPNDKGRALATTLTALHKRVHFQFDYEHQSFLSETNGQPAPASGWAANFAWRDDEGLFATDVRWTKKAQEMIDGDEYRYISPAIAYDKDTAEVTGVVNASLVGIPNLEELGSVAQVIERMSAQFSLSQPQQEKSTVNPLLKAMLAALGLTDTASEAEATNAIATLRAKADRVDGLNTEVATLKSAAPDAAKFVPMERFSAISGELALLKNAAAGQEVDKVIDEAKTAGKVVSDTVEKVWRDVGKTDIAQLKALVDGTPANPALAGRQQTTGKKLAGEVDGGEASETEIAICKNMGISVEDYRKASLVAQA